MKICYLGNFGNAFSDTTEKHITHSLTQLGHEVIQWDEKDFSIRGIVGTKADMLLFHKGGTSMGVSLENLVELLSTFPKTKVCWYFDKIYKDRAQWAEVVVPYVDHFFVTDETWMRRHTYTNVHVLHQGIGDTDMSLGVKTEPVNEVVFLGSVYGDRQRFVAGLREVYDYRFKVVGDSFGRNLYNLCASTKIFVAPLYPQDNFYWSSRVYMVLGSGGFLIHPQLDGMRSEFIDGVNLVTYRNGKELKEKIDYYLAHDEEREAIRKAGYELVTQHYTYTHRVKELLNVCGTK